MIHRSRLPPPAITKMMDSELPFLDPVQAEVSYKEGGVVIPLSINQREVIEREKALFFPPGSLVPRRRMPQVR